MIVLTTPRLRLEPVGAAHFDGLLAMNSDPEVMRYITGKPDTAAQTLEMLERVKLRWEQHGFSWWSFVERDTGEFIGAGAVQYLARDPANPLELAWRLRRDKWGQGYASEAARRMAEHAFDAPQGDLVCAVCHPDNHGSANVMKKLGMRYRGLETWYEMTTAVYEMTREEWRASIGGQGKG